MHHHKHSIQRHGTAEYFDDSQYLYNGLFDKEGKLLNILFRCAKFALITRDDLGVAKQLHKQ